MLTDGAHDFVGHIRRSILVILEADVVEEVEVRRLGATTQECILDDGVHPGVVIVPLIHATLWSVPRRQIPNGLTIPRFVSGLSLPFQQPYRAVLNLT